MRPFSLDTRVTLGRAVRYSETMRLRLSAIDEFQLLTCFKFGLWGAKTDRFGEWQQGDYLLLTVNKSLAALAEVAGKPFKSNERVWDNGLYPYRIPIRFLNVAQPQDRPLLLGEIRDVLTSVWGPIYGWGILNQQLLEGDAAEKLVSAIKSAPNSIEYFREHLANELEEAEGQRKSKAKGGTKWTPQQVAKEVMAKVITQLPAILDEQPTPKEASAHHRTQDTLKRLGKITGCSVWIASNDKSKDYKGRPLSDGTLQKLPSLGLNEDAISRISLIDVIWIQQGAPVCAFEVETTTSIYSGLLRMSDLLAVVPALKINLFIIAPRDRQNRFLAELSRPTFRKIGLSDYCRFIAIEDLEGLVNKVSDLQGIQPVVLNSIALQLPDEIDN
jgi:hypothetical protein